MVDDLVKKMQKQCENMECGNCNTCLHRKAAEELSKRRWIPVTERLPKWSETVYEGEPCVDGELVLVFAPKGEADKVWNNMAVGSWLGDRWEVLDDAFTLNAITHWMPLPQPPEEEK